ncbi:MAG TPA: pilus assembly PilX N-terminal domain-containing protein [Tepidisphaeraceae bacterium]|nr:pilus assembly PilX N-terminal domain-containing protein [Tepidisphaeraceae bacterium]
MTPSLRSGLLATGRRGAVAALAMIYLMLFGTLAVAMYSMSTLNSQTAANYSDFDKARGAAESGLHWIEYRFTRMARPKTLIGNITPTVANNLWPSIRTSITTDLNTLFVASERPTQFTNNHLLTSWIATDNTPARFQIDITQDPTDTRKLIISSTGRYHGALRTITMKFHIEKKIKYAIAGKVPIQIGRNTLVEGPIAMVAPNRMPPLIMLSDFRHLTSSLKGKIDSFNDFCEKNHAGYDNRINTENTTEYKKALAAGFTDYNRDGAVDEYDLFVREFDRNGDIAVDQSEFTNPSTGKLYDPELFSAIDSLSAPKFAGDLRIGYQNGIIDNEDGYAKVRGQINISKTAKDWQSQTSSGTTIHDQMLGPTAPETSNSATPVQLGVDPGSLVDLNPANFQGVSDNFRSRSGAGGGAPVNTVSLKANVTLDATMANGGAVVEQTPYGSVSYEATYKRPVFSNMTLRNCIIPKGLNARFDNCKFEGVTFVDITQNITRGGVTTKNAGEGLAWSERMRTGSFNHSTALTAANSYGFTDGNNLHFNNCTFNGPLAGADPSAYTYFTNKWEFTGATMFDNQVDQTATIVSPQTSIEMGSFTAPGSAPSTLTGVVVVGNLDIRGTSRVDGSIIVTGDGAINTTLGYFGNSDGSTDTTSIPKGGLGKLNIMYNPNRPLPDGINMAIDLTADPSTYVEGRLAIPN